MIEIKVNSQSLQIEEGKNLSETLIIAGFEKEGHFAVAVNKVVIPAKDRNNYIVKDGDEILLFGAVKGG